MSMDALSIEVDIIWQQRKHLSPNTSDWKQWDDIPIAFAHTVRTTSVDMAKRFDKRWNAVFDKNVLDLRDPLSADDASVEKGEKIQQRGRLEWTRMYSTTETAGGKGGEKDAVEWITNAADYCKTSYKTSQSSASWIWGFFIEGGKREEVYAWEFGWSLSQYNEFLDGIRKIRDEEYSRYVRAAHADTGSLSPAMQRKSVSEAKGGVALEDWQSYTEGMISEIDRLRGALNRGKNAQIADSGPIRETKHSVIDPELHKGGSLRWPRRGRVSKKARDLSTSDRSASPIASFVSAWWWGYVMPILRERSGRRKYGAVRRKE